LLASHDDGGFMQRSSDRNDSAELQAELARLKPEEGEDRIGNYKLLQQIGEGGFGTVWMAEQLEPVRRRVALKIIKPGMDTKEVIVRFEQERQALALMDHPNIAKVLDAGVTPLGRPFFVMELVRGIRSRTSVTRIICPLRSGSIFSSPSATPSSTRIKRALFTATSSPRTFSSPCTMVPRVRDARR
jgi:serine/threonine protein kinase